jgi:hypothetical protein
MYPSLKKTGLASKYCAKSDHCTIGNTGIVAIIGAFMWICTACLLWKMPKIPREKEGAVPPSARSARQPPARS